MKNRLQFLCAVCLIAFPFCMLAGCGGDNSHETITIGVLNTDTGDLSSVGPTFREGLKIAKTEINKSLASEHSDIRVQLVIEDSGTTPAQALEKLALFDQQGIKTVIGPMSSSEAESLRDYSNQHGIVLISPASTASSLAKADDLLLRTTANDLGQARAISAALRYFRTSYYVPLWRADDYGDDLTFDIGNSFGRAGGAFAPGSRYAEGTQDFSGALHQLEVQVDAYRDSFGLNAASVYVVGFDEVWNIFAQASSYSILSQVRWYGSDSVALNQGALQRPEVTDFLRRVQLLSPIYAGDPSNAEFKRVRSAIETTLGYKVRPYALTAYDSALLIARTLEKAENRTLTGQALRDAIITTSKDVTGLTGNLALDANGDRASGTYEFWKIGQNGAGQDEWQPGGTYSAATGYVP